MACSRTRSALTVLALGALLAPESLRAELAAWDRAKVTEISRQLAADADALYRRPPTSLASGQERAYYRIRQRVRHIRFEARVLAASLASGEGQEATLPVYEDLMQAVHLAREDARHVFAPSDVTERAAAACRTLNPLDPYYDPDFQALEAPRSP
jgi:hypothetical protein